jgi:hypothetical protein
MRFKLARSHGLRKSDWTHETPVSFGAHDVLQRSQDVNRERPLQQNACSSTPANDHAFGVDDTSASHSRSWGGSHQPSATGSLLPSTEALDGLEEEINRR